MSKFPKDTEGVNLIIVEQHRDYDYLLKIYERAGAKENVLLTAAFAILAYLYYTPPIEGRVGIIERLFVPMQDYGLIIYVIAAGFFFFGLFKLMLSVFGDNVWETAYETSKADYPVDKYGTAKYVKTRYDIAHKINLGSYLKRKANLQLCFYCILISAIILIVIKTLK